VAVNVDIEKKSWLADLVAGALHAYDPAAALLRLPPELRGADTEGPSLEARARALLVRSLRRKLLDPSSGAGEDAFLGPIGDHVGLALDIALVHGAVFDLERRRADLATFFAALTGAFDLARAAEPAKNGTVDAAAVRKAFIRAGAALKARGHPPGDPKQGIPLRIGVLCIQRRQLARLAIAYYAEQHLDVAAARKLADQASSDAVLLVEALSSIASTPEPLDGRRRRTALAQVTRLGFPRELARDARAAVRAPRSAPELARACPVRLRAFLLEQLLLSELASGQTSPAHAEVVQAFADEAKIPPEQVAALQADAAELYAGHQRWLDSSPAAPEEWESLAGEWEEVADQMMEKVATAVTDNLEAIVTEIKQTGELGQLVAKAASGRTLSLDEKRKVKLQLIDLAKAVPALAIFAAPGGMLLLPLLAKLLPFNVLPSAWDAKKPPNRTLPGKKAGGS
jgi:LETM1-like protein